MADVNANNYLPSSVKSVQRGQVTVGAGATTGFTISSIDPSKSFVSLEGTGNGTLYVESLAATTLTLRSDVAGARTVSYEIIEYY